MREKLLHGAKPGRKVIESLDDCFQNPEMDGGEEWRKLWHFYTHETDEEAIIRRVKRDALEHQAKYLVCSQSVLYALCLNLGIGNKEVYKVGNYTHAGMGGFGAGHKAAGTQICGAVVAARMALGIFGRADMYEAGLPREAGLSNFALYVPLAYEITNRFAERYGSFLCHEIQERYFGRHWFLEEDFEDPKQMEMHESGMLYRVVSTFAAKLCEWTAGTTAEIILRERKKLGIPTPMPLR